MKPYYDENGITIYHGDCREVLPQLEAVDLVLTSPPYNLREGQEHKGGLRVGHSGSQWARGHIAHGYESYGDNLPYPEYIHWQHEILRLCWDRLTPTGAIFYNHKPRIVRGELRLPPAMSVGLPLRQIVTWDRGGGFNCTQSGYMPVVEWLIVLAKEGFRLRDKSASAVGDCWRISPELNTPHPAPFPLKLATQVLSTTAASIVLDPFAGSGTTLLAAQRLGINAIGIEISEVYCELAAKRLSQASLFLSAETHEPIRSNLPALPFC